MSLITIDENKNAVLDPSTASEFAYFERQLKYIKEQEDLLKQAIKKEMEENGIIKIDTDEITITFVGETTRETFDSKGFRADYPVLYDDYVLIKPVSSSIRIRVKQ